MFWDQAMISCVYNIAYLDVLYRGSVVHSFKTRALAIIEDINNCLLNADGMLKVQDPGENMRTHSLL